MPQQQGMSRPPSGILPSDILPEAARSDPEYKDGMGATYASSQPNLAYKYGVLRNGEHVPPQALNKAKPGLSQQTIEGLQAVQAAQAAASGQPRPAMTGRRPINTRAPLPPPEEEVVDAQTAVEEAKKKLDSLDFSTLSNMMRKDLLNNDDQRKIIEARCTPMDVSDILVHGYVVQRVPVLPGKFEPSFQSLQANEDLAIKRLIMKESKGIEVSDQYLLDKFSLMTCVLSLYAINGDLIPDHRDAKGEFDDTKFWEKFNFLARYPLNMIGSLGVNSFWFDMRVRKLFVAENLGNG